MLERDELVRRVRRFLELPVAERPAKSYTLTKLAGLDRDSLAWVLQHEMRPDRFRRLSRVLELLERGQIPDVDTLPRGPKRYKTLALNPVPAPPCKPMMVLDLSRGAPRMATAFVNPNTMPELGFTRVKR